MEFKIFVYHTIVTEPPPLPINLGKERLSQLQAISNPQAQALSIAGDILLSYAIQQHISNPPAIVERTTQGKPFLSNLPQVHFSISHSQNHVVCALCPMPIGIDLEVPRPVHPRLISRYFTPQEQTIVQEQPTAFFDIWTAKEAVLKEIGCGLSGGLQNVNIATTPYLHLTSPVFGKWHTLTKLSLSIPCVISTPCSLPLCMTSLPFSNFLSHSIAFP